MKILLLLKLAFRSMQGNKLRSFLTMLGIIIGVASVIILISIGQGSGQQVESQINQLGTNLITLNVFDTENGGLTEEEVMEFQEIEGVEQSSPSVSGRVFVKKDKTTGQVSVTGTNEAYKEIRDLDMQEGRFITDIDLEYNQKVAVLGSETAMTYFGASSPVGEKIQIQGVSYKVIGVLASKGTSLGQSGDDVIILPLGTAQRLIGSEGVSTVLLQAKSENEMAAVKMFAQVLMSLLYPGEDDSYSVTTQQDLMETVGSVTETMTLMLAGIAGISLLVGGIGIMNIMLVSVSERTKEIGIRKAIGAKRIDILWQFLIEAVSLSACGGVLGVLIGVGGSKLLSLTAGMTVEYSIPVMAMAFLFSLIVGVIFGVIPANKASKLHPIQALRFE
ncbi:ABC transporter permease [Peribacillus alkalitolerans]|uniref:ABC transporter permease n=1 Tax=Peribacillus alkalitolerans TaxID=1550385 RepID=UPI0013D83224|nr:ABC transporter permease [Peribacillus alkalitolerans]